MNGTSPRSLRSLVLVLLIATIAFAIMAVIFILATGSIPDWALALLFASLIALVIIRIVAMVGYGYPPYDSSRLFAQNKEQKEEKK